MSVEMNTISDFEKRLEIKKIGDHEFEGINPLSKPAPQSRGVYGGDLCAQSIVVAMETVPKGFVPHSLHSYFVAAGDDTLTCTYTVEELSNGKNFANRLVKLFQQGKLRYIIMISLTKRNSINKMKDDFENNKGKIRPFEFQLPPGHQFKPENISELPGFKSPSSNLNQLLSYRLTPDFINKNEDELLKTPSERKLSFYVKLNQHGKLPDNFRYGSMGCITDALYLSSIARILHLPNPKNSGGGGANNSTFFSLSLDHSVYFHDDDFDPTTWLYFVYNAPRFSNNRALFQGGYYNDKGKLIASIVQEGLVFFNNDSELKAKL